jgi:hypothetical protein
MAWDVQYALLSDKVYIYMYSKYSSMASLDWEALSSLPSESFWLLGRGLPPSNECRPREEEESAQLPPFSPSFAFSLSIPLLFVFWKLDLRTAHLPPPSPLPHSITPLYRTYMYPTCSALTCVIYTCCYTFLALLDLPSLLPLHSRCPLFELGDYQIQIQCHMSIIRGTSLTNHSNGAPL